MTSNSQLVAKLLSLLDQSGVRVSVHGVNLDLDAPKGVLSPDLLNLIRSVKAELRHEVELRTPCTRCGAGTFVDVVIHGGRSRRRDCAVCGLTKGFPVWGPTSVTRVPPRGDYRNN